jgi:hypothetical protein
LSAASILSELQRLGVSVTSDGDALVLKPRRALDAALLARVREHKPEIIRALSARPATCAASCYEIEPGRWIHHPWDGCQTPMPPTKPRQAAERACWHCQGARFCACSTCAQGLACDSSGRCVACHGRGKVWIQ